MPQAYKCDRCGVFFTKEEHAANLQTLRYMLIDTGAVDGDAVLCPDCSKKLHEWMENKPEPNLHHIYLNVHRPDPCPRCSFTFEPKKKRWWER